MNGLQLDAPAGIVFKIQKYAIHDGPGIRTTVFLKGCPLNCWWCHNPESISPAIEAVGSRDGRQERIGRMVTPDQVMAEVEKDRIFYEESGGGVTLSGGEPLMQPDFALALARACSDRDLHVVLDTAGHGAPRALERLLQWVDLVLFDLKLADAALHKRYTGLDNDRILNNLDRLDASTVPYRIRIPVVPGVTDSPAALEGLITVLDGLQRRPDIDLLPYHASAEAKYDRFGFEYRLRGLEPPSVEQVACVESQISRCGFKTQIGG